MNISRFLLIGLFITVASAGCFGSLAAISENVPISDFFGLKPTVKIEWPKMTLTIPTNYPSSTAYISAKAKVDGNDIIVSAKYVLRKKPATTIFNLKKLGIREDRLLQTKVFWQNPDGTKQELQSELIQREKQNSSDSKPPQKE